MELHDMGEIRNTVGEIAPTQGKSKKEKYYPSTYLSSKKLPEIAAYDVGDKCRLVSEVKVIGKREKEDGEIEVEVETRQCGIMKGKVSENEYKDMSDEEKDEADEKEVMEKEE